MSWMPTRENIPRNMIVQVNQARKDDALGVDHNTCIGIRHLICYFDNTSIFDQDVSMLEHTFRCDNCPSQQNIASVLRRCPGRHNKCCCQYDCHNQQYSKEETSFHCLTPFVNIGKFVLTKAGILQPA